MTTQSKALIPAATIQKIDQYWRAGLKTQTDQSVQDPTAFRLSIARQRYKEGFTTPEQFIAELRSLQCPEDQIPLEVIAGNFQAAYDYAMDLIATYRDAYRQGNIDIATFAEQIAKIVVVRARAETYIARELARQKPSETLSLAPVAKAYYLTDAGKIEIDTIRRLRRKDQLDRPTEIRELQSIGMPEALATAYADNDSARLGESGAAV